MSKASSARPILRPLHLAGLLLCATLVLGACNKDDAERIDSRSAAELYSEAKNQLDNNAYDRAVRSYKQLQTRFPFGRFAEQAQLEMAYAYPPVFAHLKSTPILKPLLS